MGGSISRSASITATTATSFTSVSAGFSGLLIKAMRLLTSLFTTVAFSSPIRSQMTRALKAKASRFLQSTKVPDRFLAHAIDLLARDVDSKRHDLISIDYKSLGVRQLGSIYEGLLEFKLRIAEEKLAIISEKNRKIYIPFQQTDAE